MFGGVTGLIEMSKGSFIQILSVTLSPPRHIWKVLVPTRKDCVDYKPVWWTLIWLQYKTTDITTCHIHLYRIYVFFAHTVQLKCQYLKNKWQTKHRVGISFFSLHYQTMTLKPRYILSCEFCAPNCPINKQECMTRSINISNYGSTSVYFRAV